MFLVRLGRILSGIRIGQVVHTAQWSKGSLQLVFGGRFFYKATARPRFHGSPPLIRGHLLVVSSVDSSILIILVIRLRTAVLTASLSFPCRQPRCPGRPATGAVPHVGDCWSRPSSPALPGTGPRFTALPGTAPPNPLAMTTPTQPPLQRGPTPPPCWPFPHPAGWTSHPSPPPIPHPLGSPYQCPITKARTPTTRRRPPPPAAARSASSPSWTSGRLTAHPRHTARSPPTVGPPLLLTLTGGRP